MLHLISGFIVIAGLLLANIRIPLSKPKSTDAR
jgi:hypothetical protein